jgi:hypothetical protein
MLFEPTARKSLDDYTVTRSAILVNELDNVHNRIYAVRYEKGAWTRSLIPGLPDLGKVFVSSVNARESDDFWLTTTDFTTPTRFHLGHVGKGAAEKLKEQPAFFDASRLEVSQHEALSKDGTRIPYFQVSPKGMKTDGGNPTLLYGYGGFEISELPTYSGTRGAGWLERGGVLAVANIRGGGEFGPAWHQAGVKAERHHCYEDFIAVGEDLVKRKITSPRHLGCIGGSNGGLLTGNMLVMRPDLFGAVVSQVPLLDMRRYHHLLAGASWMGEYGNPDDPKEWAFIQGFALSPAQARREVPADALHDLDSRRPRPSRPRAQDDGEHERHGPGRPLLREHRGRPRRRGQQPAGGAHGRARLHLPVAAARHAAERAGAAQAVTATREEGASPQVATDTTSPEVARRVERVRASRGNHEGVAADTGPRPRPRSNAADPASTKPKNRRVVRGRVA